MLNMSTLSERLQECLADLDIKAAELARRIDVSKATTSLWLNGTTKQLDGDNLLKAAFALGVEARWLQSGQGPKKRQGSQIDAASRPANSVPILPWTAAHQHNTPQAAVAAVDWRPNMTTRDRVFYLRADNESHYGSRELPLNQEALLLIDPDASAEVLRSAGRPVFGIVRIPAGDNLLRKLVIEGSRTYLHPLNPLYPPELMPDESTIVGLVAGVRIDTLFS